ncbi:uncharacterized protein LOC102801539 [Saccoglossus kowalevskii]|uniref:RNA-binding protein 7-like n=1 Tax=Saccoglossus kowalevskii TaxID=10224 RepID=A0ABM0MT42_SACKO|nr:PREDICTED: RNA-binding protein 7-like [Saccoglossus kowalevskii]
MGPGSGENKDDRTLWVGNLDTKVTEDVLYELFVQAGPLIDVKIAKDKEGNRRNYAFVEFKHDVSIPYTIQLMNGIRVYDRPLKIQCRPNSKHDFAQNMGRNSPQQQDGYGSRQQTPNTSGNAGILPSPHMQMQMPPEHSSFHRSHSMPANLSTFASQRSMQQPSHYQHRQQYRSDQRQHFRQQFQGSATDMGYQSQQRRPMTPSQVIAMNQQQYRPPNIPQQPWQPSSQRGHYGYR